MRELCPATLCRGDVVSGDAKYQVSSGSRHGMGSAGALRCETCLSLVASHFDASAACVPALCCCVQRKARCLAFMCVGTGCTDMPCLSMGPALCTPCMGSRCAWQQRQMGAWILLCGLADLHLALPRQHSPCMSPAQHALIPHL